MARPWLAMTTACRHSTGCATGAMMVNLIGLDGDDLRRRADRAAQGVADAVACQGKRRASSSNRVGSPYRSGRSRDWIKMKNPATPAVKREAEEDWAKRNGDER